MMSEKPPAILCCTSSPNKKGSCRSSDLKNHWSSFIFDNSVKLSNKLSTPGTSLRLTNTRLIHSRRSSLCLLRLLFSVNSQDNGDGHNPDTSYRTIIASSTTSRLREGLSPVHLFYSGKHCCFISQLGTALSLTLRYKRPPYLRCTPACGWSEELFPQ